MTTPLSPTPPVLIRAFAVDAAGTAEIVTYDAQHWPGIVLLARLTAKEQVLARLAELAAEFTVSSPAPPLPRICEHCRDNPVLLGGLCARCASILRYGSLEDYEGVQA